MIIKRNKCKFFNILISFILLSLFSVLCFSKVRFNAIGGAADIQFHLKRVLELKESISHGNLLPVYSFNFFHGSSIMSMYPYISVYPFALLLFIVPSLIKSYYIFVICIIFIALLFSFFGSLRFSKSILVSYIFSISYGLSSTFMFEFFNSSDLGRATALAVLPLSIFGFIDILNGSDSYLKLSIGLILLIDCQVPAFIIVIIFLILWTIININYLSKEKIIILFRSIILSILTSSIIWLPMIHTILMTKIYSVYVPNVLISAGVKQFIESIGFVALASIIISFINFKKFSKLGKQMYILSLFVCFISTKLMPWDIVSGIPFFHVINHFQDAFRFLMIPQILLCYLFAVNISFISKTHAKKLCVYIVLLILIVLQLFSQIIDIHHKLNSNLTPITSYKTEKNYMTKSTKYFFSGNQSIKYIIYGYSPYYDYYPVKSIPKQKSINSNKATYNTNKLKRINYVGYNKLLLNSSKEIYRIILPIIHYNGEHLCVYVNHHLKRFSTNKNGLITLNNIKRGKNIVNIQYQPNLYLVLLKDIMFLIGISWIIVIYVNKIKNMNLIKGDIHAKK